MTQIRPLLLCACTLLALSACKHVPSNAAPVASTVISTTAAPNAASADDNLNAVLWVQRSAEYQALSEQTYRAAANQLDAALKNRHWDALVPEERGNAATGLKPAVVLDVDETVLDNSPYQARLIRDHAQYDDATWEAWVAEKKAKAVPGVVEFAKAANAKGVTLIYISNRAVQLKEATLANLRQVGLPVANDNVFLGLGTAVPGCAQHGTEKNCRRKLAGQKYRVLMQFGDQLGDFVQITDNTPAGRQQLLDRYHTWFGQRWWMLAGPSYGSWEPALFNNNWKLSPDARRAAKQAALELDR